MRVLKRGFACLSLFALTGQAIEAAMIIDFEDLAVAPGTQTAILADVTSDGFTFDSTTDHFHLANNFLGFDSGSTYLVTDDADGDTSYAAMRLASGAFNVERVDLAGWNTALTSAKTILVTGHYAGGGTVATSISMDVTPTTFQTEFFSSAWTNLTTVVFKGTGSTSVGDYFSIDNIHWSNYEAPTAVPEPGTILALLSLAAVGGAAAYRRRKS